MGDTLADRVAWLIRHSHGGNVNAASAATGLPQSTLARIADGRVQSPRADALLALATYYRTNVDWLLCGLGAAPPVPPRAGPFGITREEIGALLDASEYPTTAYGNADLLKALAAKLAAAFPPDA